MLDRLVPAQLKDLALLLARVGVGIIFIAHGWQKITEGGIGGTAKGFETMGVPAPTISAGYATVVELVGGAALILGALLPLVGLLLFLDMAGAFVFVHMSHGLFADKGGFELVLALGAAALLLGALGSGRYGLDTWLGRRAGDRRIPARS